jgi:hypothetical protein
VWGGGGGSVESGMCVREMAVDDSLTGALAVCGCEDAVQRKREEEVCRGLVRWAERVWSFPRMVGGLLGVA